MFIQDLLIIFALSSGQLLKFPFLNLSISNLLDLTVGVLVLANFIYFRKSHLKPPPLYIPIGLIFIIFGFISLAVSPLTLTHQNLFFSYSYGLRFLMYLLFAWQIYSYHKQESCSPYLYSSLIIAFFGLIQVTFIPEFNVLIDSSWDPHFLRTVSTLLDPNFTGGFLVIGLAILSFKKFNRYTALIFLAIFLALLTTLSRSAYLNLAVTFIVLSLLRKSPKLFLVTCLMGLAIVMTYFTYIKNLATTRNIDRTQSAQYRVSSWQQGIGIFQKEPYKGVGYNAYRFALKEYNLADITQLESRGGTSNDSSLLFVLSTTGVIGLIIYLLFLTEILKRGLSALNTKKGIILTSTLLGLITQSFFVNTLFYPPFLLWILFSANLVRRD